MGKKQACRRPARELDAAVETLKRSASCGGTEKIDVFGSTHSYRERRETGDAPGNEEKREGPFQANQKLTRESRWRVSRGGGVQKLENKNSARQMPGLKSLSSPKDKKGKSRPKQRSFKH